jgi:predicted nucleic acid-binding protein
LSPLGVVLDACVLYPAALRDTLLRAALAGLYRLHWSDQILDEVRRNLVENDEMSAEQAERLIAKMREAFPEATVVGYERLVQAMATDEKDRHVAAAAVAAGAQVIVTSNLKDFPRAALEPFGLVAQSPDELLVNLVDLAPRAMVDILRAQAARLRNPPMSVEEVLEDVGLQAPEFAELMLHLLRL